ncbi:MAG: DNA-binding protein, partial [Proteobacteria bacterium]|nr:DNA-binding protein [Pseudomonadota bacterium]
GPRMMTNIVNLPQTPEALQLDMPLKVRFESLSDDISLAYFEPLDTGEATP